MSKMENRGQELLNKWLSGEINYIEELELFELATNDNMLKEALEGYIIQDEILPIEKSTILQWQKGETTTRKRKALFPFRRMALIAAVLIVVLMSSVMLIFIDNEGQEAKQLLVNVNLDKQEPLKKELESIEVVEKVVNQIAVKDNAKVESSPSNNLKSIEQKVKDEVVLDKNNFVADAKSRIDKQVKIKDEIVESIVEKEELVAINNSETLKEEAVVKDIEPAIISMTENEVTPFNEQADKDLKNKVYAVAKKELDKETSITVFDIDVKDGIDPNELDNGGLDTSIVDDKAVVTTIGSSADAAGEHKQLKTNTVSNNIVVKEYQIEKRDILNPPMEDFNTLVRARYKRKGKPIGGYLKYKQYLRESSVILVDTYKNADHLEDVSIKFRVFKNGAVEFIELFGVENAQCIKTISAAITSGPKWELQEYYESIDIEVPFKVLYPFVF